MKDCKFVNSSVIGLYRYISSKLIAKCFKFGNILGSALQSMVNFVNSVNPCLNSLNSRHVCGRANQNLSKFFVKNLVIVFFYSFHRFFADLSNFSQFFNFEKKYRKKWKKNIKKNGKNFRDSGLPTLCVNIDA